MVGWIRNVLDRRSATVTLVALILASAMFAGAGVYGIMRGQQQNEGICDAVRGLRVDVVEVVGELNKRAARSAKFLFPHNPKKQAEYVRRSNESFQSIKDRIGNPQCP